MTSTGGQLWSAVAAGLDAQTADLYGYDDIYNWIGEQNNVDGGQLDQVGIDYNNMSSFGSQMCAGGNDVDNRDIIAVTVEYNGGYLAPACFPGYIFGVGSQTMFDITWNGSTWTDWVDWNNTWEALVAAGFSALNSGNALADFVPAEVIESGEQYANPYFPSPVADTNGELENATTGWEWWFTNIPTGYVQEGDYTLTWPTAYTNVTVASP